MAGKYKQIKHPPARFGGKAQDVGTTRQFKDPGLIEQTKMPQKDKFEDGKTVPATYPLKMLDQARSQPGESVNPILPSTEQLPPPPVKVPQVGAMQEPPMRATQTDVQSVDPAALQNAINALTNAVNDLGKRIVVIEGYLRTTVRSWIEEKDRQLAQIDKELPALKNALEELKQEMVKKEDSNVEELLAVVVDVVATQINDHLEEINNKADRLSADLTAIQYSVQELRTDHIELGNHHEELVDSYNALNAVVNNLDAVVNNLCTQLMSFLRSIAFTSDQIINGIQGNNAEKKE